MISRSKWQEVHQVSSSFYAGKVAVNQVKKILEDHNTNTYGVKMEKTKMAGKWKWNPRLTKISGS